MDMDLSPETPQPAKPAKPKQPTRKPRRDPDAGRESADRAVRESNSSGIVKDLAVEIEQALYPWNEDSFNCDVNPPKLNKKKRAKARNARLVSQAATESMDQLIARLRLGTDWDFIIHGDGSGSQYGNACGWAAASVERETGERKVWYGYMNDGTVNMAEAMAYVQALNWLVAKHEAVKGNAKHRVRRAYRIHLVTDSEYCKHKGSSDDRMFATNIMLWAAIDAVARLGYVLRWHHVNRETTALNQYTDRLSRLARTFSTEYNLQARAEEEASRTVYDHNPSTADDSGPDSAEG